MARYFVDVLNNGTRVLDETGLELDDLKAAIGEAARALADMTEGSLRQELRIEIRSTMGEAILSVLLALEFSGLRALGVSKH
ncbi:hypothetical protein AB4144_21470 [Rhizobiaceae sp. 2RAB30]